MNLTLLTACQAPSGPPVTEQASATFSAQLLTAIGNIDIRNSIVNGTNNASGGLIVLINNAPQWYNLNPASIITPNFSVGTDNPRMNRRGPIGNQQSLILESHSDIHCQNPNLGRHLLLLIHFKHRPPEPYSLSNLGTFAVSFSTTFFTWALL